MKQADVQVRDLELLREQPIAATAQVELARAQLEVARITVVGAEAALAGAEARLDGARQGATATQIGVAEAQLAQARAATKIFEAQASKGTVISPRAGTVVRAIAHLGETVTPGTPLVVWHDASDLTLTVYVGEMDVGRVKQALPVTITVASLPGETYKGTVRNPRKLDVDSTRYFPATRDSYRGPDSSVRFIHRRKPRIPVCARG